MIERDGLLIDLEHILGDRPLTESLGLRNQNLELEKTTPQVIKVCALIEDSLVDGKILTKPSPELLGLVQVLIRSLHNNFYDPYAHIGLGMFNSRLLQHRISLDHYLISDKVSTDKWALKSGLLTKIGNAYFGLNDYEKGKKYHLAAIKLDHLNRGSPLSLATHFRLMEDYDAALKYAYAVFDKFPGFLPAKRIINQILIEKYSKQ